MFMPQQRTRRTFALSLRTPTCVPVKIVVVDSHGEMLYDVLYGNQAAVKQCASCWGVAEFARCVECP